MRWIRADIRDKTWRDPIIRGSFDSAHIEAHWEAHAHTDTNIVETRKLVLVSFRSEHGVFETLPSPANSAHSSHAQIVSSIPAANTAFVLHGRADSRPPEHKEAAQEPPERTTATVGLSSTISVVVFSASHPQRRGFEWRRKEARL